MAITDIIFILFILFLFFLRYQFLVNNDFH